MRERLPPLKLPALAKTWRYRESPPPPPEIDGWADDLSISDFLARLLWTRGLRSPLEMDRYLSPKLRDLAPLSCCPGLDQAASVLAKGLTDGLPMAVWGDYDVDGVTATALVMEFLRDRGFEALGRLPTRSRDGYGLNVAGIEQLYADGVRLLLTVDCGVGSVVEVARARELGMTVVISDHHLPGEELPKADAICNPRLSPCEYETLAGAGVAFLVMAALNRLLPGEPADMKKYLDLAAMGALADVVELLGPNRIIVQYGLKLIAEAKRPGVAALKEVAGHDASALLGASQVSFGLAPRINAAGRMDDASHALKLLLTKDMREARELARKLDDLNRDRQREEEEILHQALEQALAFVSARKARGLVLYQPHWHHGVIGIVASRVVERFYRPALVLCEEKGRLKGSGRSISELDLHGTLGECSDLLSGYGGHRQAAGLSLPESNLDALRERFEKLCAEKLGEEPLAPTLNLDAELPFRLLDFTLLRELELMQPFGPGNPEPVFASPPVMVRTRRQFGANHVSMDVRDESAGVTLRAKAWRMADQAPPSMVGSNVRLAYSPRIDRYDGLAKIEAQVRDIRPA